LREAIKGLNRGQKPMRIRFRGDGTGHGIRWEEVESGRVDMPPNLPPTYPHETC
jgi:hypothetical protein